MSEETISEYRSLISGLPLTTIEYGFSYGSAAFQQRNERKEDKMVDFILCTTDPFAFHQENIAMNPSHYSMFRMVGANNVAQFQRRWGARIYYNTHVKVNRRLIKYGIIASEDLKQDLLDWSWIYAAGRLHKPVLEVISPSEDMAERVLSNRRTAMHAALLLLPDSFSLTQLFHTIVSLSYNGDFRMMIGEDKDKINKIVDGGFEHFRGIYDPIIAEDPRIVLEGTRVNQDYSTPAIYHRLNLLPSEVQNRLRINYNKRNNRRKDIEEVVFSLAHRHDVPSNVSKAISSIVAPSALSQTVKNAVSAGFTRSFVYSLAKLTKMFKSRGI